MGSKAVKECVKVLTLHQLGAVRQGRALFKDLSLSVAAGSSLVISGPNGSGKTTLLKMLAGILPPGSGQVEWGDVSRCYIGHKNALHPGLTVRQNVKFWQDLVGQSSFYNNSGKELPPPLRGGGRGRVMGIIKEMLSNLHLFGNFLSPPLPNPPPPGGRGLDLTDTLQTLGLHAALDMPVEVLSAGQQRRLALSRVLVEASDVWLLDEPLVNLDQQAQGWLLELMQTHVTAGGTVICASHQPLPDLTNAQSLVLGGAGK